MTTLPPTRERRAAYALLRWPPKLTLSEWADTYRVFPSSDPEPGPHRTDRFPLAREMQDAISDDRTREVILWGPTQTAKTSIICNMIGYAIHYDPSPALGVYPTEDTARAFAEEKLEPMINACPALTERASIGTARTHRKSILTKVFPGMRVELKGGNSENAFASRSTRYAWADELDRIPPNKEGRPADLLRQRCQNYWNRKLVLASTCTIKGASEIEAEYETSDQRRYYVPCLACGHMHVMDFVNLDFDHLEDPEAAREAARYRCPECQHEHWDADKPAMLARGEWRAERPGRAKAGFWWSALYSPWVTFGDLAYEYRQSKDDDEAYRVFLNCRLAKTWEIKTDLPAESALLEVVDADRPAGTVPDWATVLTGGVDVQRDSVYFVIRAWGPPHRSALVLHGNLPRNTSTLDFLDDVFAVPYSGKPVLMTLIDSGWDEEVVYDHCIPRRNCLPSKGVPEDRPDLVKATELTRERGHYYGRRFALWNVNSHRLRERIHGCIGYPADHPRAWRLHAGIMDDHEYQRHILAKARQEKRVRGRTVYEWVDVRKDDHYLDAEIYAMAAALLPQVSPLIVARRRPPAQSEPVSAGSRGRINRSY